MTPQDQLWLDDVAGRLTAKLARTSRRIGDSLPFVSVNGRYQNFDGRENALAWWTNGFWPGLLWLAYRETGDEFYRTTAESCEKQLDGALYGFDGLHHDVGFMWSLSSVANFKLTGNDASRRRALLAASTLASRFNLKGGYIRAWNGDNQGWAIVDCLMNLPLLYWASEQTNDPRFAHVARAHADTAIRAVQRPDGSVNHIVHFDPDTGEVRETLGGQGYGVGSSWSRGQAWAVYGFALSYRHSGDVRYLDAAKRTAHYVLANLALGAGGKGVPAVDFRAPPEPAQIDSTAGAITAAGLLEIASHVPELEKALYHNAAVQMLQALDTTCGAWQAAEEGLLLEGTHAYHDSKVKLYPNNHSPIIYGDYYFAEAIYRLRGQTALFW
ncbi:MAG: glycoside hydrolase family 88 protein [Spirochaetales bacterium]